MGLAAMGIGMPLYFVLAAFVGSDVVTVVSLPEGTKLEKSPIERYCIISNKFHVLPQVVVLCGGLYPKC